MIIKKIVSIKYEKYEKYEKEYLLTDQANATIILKQPSTKFLENKGSKGEHLTANFSE